MDNADIAHHRFPFGTHFFTTFVIFMYLGILKIVSNAMKTRSAYSLKKFMMCYNVYQIVACIAAMKMYLDSKVAFWELYCPESRPIDSYIAYNIGFFVYWVKVSEMSETVVFLLRKKNNQVTPLHVFHHCVTVTFIYVSCAYDFQSGAFLAVFTNCVVHVLMYLYYLITVLFSKWNLHKIKPLKQALTLIQIAQFLLMLFHLLAHQVLGCSYPSFVSIWYAFGYSVFLVLFIDFYRKSYKKTDKKNN
ncbi:hypothetical protein ACFFRR_000118 [Megaselia abdita]